MNIILIGFRIFVFVWLVLMVFKTDWVCGKIGLKEKTYKQIKICGIVGLICEFIVIVMNILGLS